MQRFRQTFRGKISVARIVLCGALAVSAAILAMAVPGCTTSCRAPVGETLNSSNEITFTKLTPAEIDARAGALLARMTLAEKVKLLAFEGSLDTPGIKRLGIPELVMSDASVGVRRFYPSVAYPASICLAATWNPGLARQTGVQLGRDCRARGISVLFGPGVNIMRESQGGRNFEFMGEDPFLTSRLSDQWIDGLQSERVAACVKHFVGNEQETNRFVINSVIGRRALEEIYLPPFRNAILKAHCWTIMAAYNQLNGVYCSGNHFLLNGLLRKRWGFKGVAMSDWDATHSTLGSLKAGLDLEMHSPKYYNMTTIPPLLKSGRLSIHNINTHVRRMLRMMIAMGFMGHTQKKSCIPLNNPAGQAAAMKTEAQGAVLLKNAGHFLPLAAQSIQSIVVLGPMASPAVTGGGGSSYVRPIGKPVSMLAAIRKAVGPKVTVHYIPYIGKSAAFQRQPKWQTNSGKPGLMLRIYNQYITNNNMTITTKPISQRIVSRLGTPLAMPTGVPLPANFSAIWTGKFIPVHTGEYMMKMLCNGGVDIYINDKLLVEQWRPAPLIPYLNAFHFIKGHAYHIKFLMHPSGPASTYVTFGLHRLAGPLLAKRYDAMVREADAVVACVGYGPRIERENLDRTYKLSADQDEYLREVSQLNHRTVVVVNAGAGIAMHNWIHQVDGLLYAWYPGQNGNTAIADIIFGGIDPSGHLPDTFSRRLRDEPAYGHFPGHHDVVHFKEGIFVGYRWYDKKKIAPRYPFGFGLSYTTFAMSHLALAAGGSGRQRVIAAAIAVTNTGKRAGADVVQFYVRPPHGPVVRCVQNLKGFKRVNLQPGQTKTITVTLNWHDFAFYNTKLGHWQVPHGSYGIAVGDSSRHIVATGAVNW